MALYSRALIFVLFSLTFAAGTHNHPDCKSFYAELSALKWTNQQIVAKFDRVVQEYAQIGTFQTSPSLSEVLQNFSVNNLDEVLGTSKIETVGALHESIKQTVAQHMQGQDSTNFDLLFESLKEPMKRFLVGKCPKTEKENLDKEERSMISNFIRSRPKSERAVLRDAYKAVKPAFKKWVTSYAHQLNDFECQCRGKNAFQPLVSRLEQIFLRITKEPHSLTKENFEDIFERTTALCEAIYTLNAQDYLSIIENQFQNALMFREGKEYELSNAYFRKVLHFMLKLASKSESLEEVGSTLLRVIYNRLAAIMEHFPMVHDLLSARCHNQCNFNFFDTQKIQESRILIAEYALSQVVNIESFENSEVPSETDLSVLSNSQIQSILDNFDVALNFDSKLINSLSSAVPLLSTIEVLLESSKPDENHHLDQESLKTRYSLMSGLLEKLNEFLLSSEPIEDHKSFVVSFDKFLSHYKNDEEFEKYEELIRIWNLLSYFNSNEEDYEFEWRPSSENSTKFREHYKWFLDHIFEHINNEIKDSKVNARNLYKILELQTENVVGKLEDAKSSKIEFENFDVKINIEEGIDVHGEEQEGAKDKEPEWENLKPLFHDIEDTLPKPIHHGEHKDGLPTVKDESAPEQQNEWENLKPLFHDIEDTHPKPVHHGEHKDGLPTVRDESTPSKPLLAIEWREPETQKKSEETLPVIALPHQVGDPKDGLPTVKESTPSKPLLAIEWREPETQKKTEETLPVIALPHQVGDPKDGLPTVRDESAPEQQNEWENLKPLFYDIDENLPKKLTTEPLPITIPEIITVNYVENVLYEDCHSSQEPRSKEVLKGNAIDDTFVIYKSGEPFSITKEEYDQFNAECDKNEVHAIFWRLNEKCEPFSTSESYKRNLPQGIEEKNYLIKTKEGETDVSEDEFLADQKKCKDDLLVDITESIIENCQIKIENFSRRSAEVEDKELFSIISIEGKKSISKKDFEKTVEECNKPKVFKQINHRLINCEKSTDEEDTLTIPENGDIVFKYIVKGDGAENSVSKEEYEKAIIDCENAKQRNIIKPITPGMSPKIIKELERNPQMIEELKKNPIMIDENGNEIELVFVQIAREGSPCMEVLDGLEYDD